MAAKPNARYDYLIKMLLIGDIAGDDADEVARVTSEVSRMANTRSGLPEPPLIFRGAATIKVPVGGN